ncbi:MAG: arylsulfatase [Myxococcota bacterium]
MNRSLSHQARPSPKPHARLRSASATLFAGLFAGLLLGLVLPAAALAGQPNVVVILADDLGWADVGYHGAPIETPSIDRLAKEGVQFDRFYAAPICSPTRAALMTGRDPLKLGIAYDQIHPWYNAGLSPNAITIADVFKADGYQTALVGKWHLGHTTEKQVPNANGFEHFWGHLHTNTDYFTHQREGGHDLQENGKSVREPGEYLTRLEGREAVRFIRERDRKRPFFLYVPFTAPHSPMQAPKETIEKYAALPKAKNRRVYAAMVDEMDQQIGKILDALDEAEIADETLVLFMSDNGGSTSFGGENQPLRGQKGQAFEGGIRVPAVMRWPDELKAGQVMEQMTTVMDMLPTLASAVRVRVPITAELDGQNMWPAIVNGQKSPRKKPVGFVSEIPIPGVIQTAIFDGRWKLVQVIQEKQTETLVKSFLFDIDADPFEKTDLSEQYSAVRKRMERLMFEWRKQHPMAGTRGTLVAHPGWVAPKSWAEAVTPSDLLQKDWTNELQFSKELFDATEDRGILVSPKERRHLLDLERERRKAMSDE